MPFEGNAGQRSNSNGQRPTSTRGSKSRASDQRLHKVCRNIVNKRNYTSLGLSTVIVACIARLDSQNTDNPPGGEKRREYVHRLSRRQNQTAQPEESNIKAPSTTILKAKPAGHCTRIYSSSQRKPAANRVHASKPSTISKSPSKRA